jgi:hypothetical protein
MSLSELVFVLVVASVGIGYGAREYGLFVATYRNPQPSFPYPPERLWRRLKVSALLVLEAVLLALTLWATRSGARPLTSLALALLTLAGLVTLFVAAVVDLRETHRQYAELKLQALTDAREHWLSTQPDAKKPSA